MCRFGRRAVLRVVFALPEAVASAEARRLQGFNRQPADRTLLLTWRGEHAESSARSDVRQGGGLGWTDPV